ncbi:MAG TPA: ATP-binding cassette domain-containing protein [Candidatus Dormibacteraeota bacterium]|nr:ATP-binding cassette domain-containing protein [Candidatus Dormibacteraeota bacterium]
MATAIDQPTDGGEQGGRGRKRRSRRRAEAVAEAAVNVPIGAAPPRAEPETPAPAAAAAESVPVAAVRKRERRRLIRRIGERGGAVRESEPAAAPAEETPVEALDGFGDLLGQAVGLRLDSVSKEFDTGDQKVVALREVSMEIGPGEFVAIIGPSGCGKSTLLSVMGGLDRPTAGKVYAAGTVVEQLSDQELSDYRLQRVATIFQTFNLVPAMSVEDNVALPMVLAGVPAAERRRRALHLLELVGLAPKARIRAGRLSGGEQQRVAVARALANRPGLILADEPTGSLDSAAGLRVIELLKELNHRGATVVLVTHDPEVARNAHRAVRMVDGRAFELDSGARTVRNQDPLLAAPRMHWFDTLRLGVSSAGRRPLRTFLTTTGVAIGIAAMSLIVALSGGLGYALSGSAFANTRVDEIVVRPASTGDAMFSSASVDVLTGQPHVLAGWGDVTMPGGFTTASTAPAQRTDLLLSLPPLAHSNGAVRLIAGTLPGGDTSTQVVLSAREAAALGFIDPASAVGQIVTFYDAAAKPVPVVLTVSGVASDVSMPAGYGGGFVPNRLMSNHWSAVAAANHWTGVGEYASVTLLADSDSTVEGLRDTIHGLGFQAQTTGDELRGFEELLGRLRVALLGLSVVALLLACLGIANTMFAAVLERTREIGILKAVGARSRDVMLLFVAEAAVLGLVGGILGGSVAALLARAGNSAVDAIVPSLAGVSVEAFRPDFTTALVALVLAVALSMGSGMLPAMRAAAQQPMKALHHE